MKRKLFLAVVMLALASSFASASVYVRGYYRKDGTYVQPHYRSDSDGNVYNNWSTKGNYNPYTGEEGTKPVSPYYYYDSYSD